MLAFTFLASSILSHTQVPISKPPAYGPYTQFFFPMESLRKTVQKEDSVLRADSAWSLYAWVKPADATRQSSLVVGLGDPEEDFPRYLALEDHKLTLWMGKDNVLSSNASMVAGKCNLLRPHSTARNSGFSAVAQKWREGSFAGREPRN